MPALFQSSVRGDIRISQGGATGTVPRPRESPHLPQFFQSSSRQRLSRETSYLKTAQRSTSTLTRCSVSQTASHAAGPGWH